MTSKFIAWAYPLTVTVIVGVPAETPVTVKSNWVVPGGKVDTLLGAGVTVAVASVETAFTVAVIGDADVLLMLTMSSSAP